MNISSLVCIMFYLQAVKYITAAPGRSEALNFNEPVQMQTEPSFPAPKGLESHAKLKKYYAYTKALADGLMFAPTPHSKLTANSWRTEEKFDFATIGKHQAYNQLHAIG